MPANDQPADDQPADDRPARNVARLADALDISPDELSVLAGYADAEVADLVAAVIAAAQADNVALQESIEHALRVIPRPIRGQARRILTGERRG